ncbi:hypothetical protein MTR67_003708 [Solanum verrucosum]|uniref:Uncharacterized protein n=1 Tax=Solanum verrucosum TaxID=315347 RepID=A0AAF0PT10_SOLVR|nr:hypothetical protein MTR67_003708 [Solanum verrucosum]
MISLNAPRYFDDLLTSAGTRSSAEYARPGSYVVQLESCPCQKLVKSSEYYINQKGRGRGFTPLSKEVST